MSPAQSTRGAPKKIDKNTLLVAQEITFAKILSGNDEKVRERGIKRLQKWLTARSSSSSQFKEKDLNRVWKGLFYCMWMSDKPLVQEEVAESISKLVHCFKNTDACMCFVKCFFHTMAIEWRGLDNWRMDKFLMFIRRFVRQVLIYLEKRAWPLKLAKTFGAVINSTILPDHVALASACHPPLGFSLHFIDIYMDELTKVSKGQLQNDDLLAALLRPFAVYLSETTERTVGLQVASQIFDRLIEQSKEGHKFREKFEAWKQLGFPGGDINTVMKVRDGDSDDEVDTDSADEEEKTLDPRAGGVDVELPVVRFNPEAVMNLLREYRHAKTSNSWSRRMVARAISRFLSMEKGQYPLGVSKVAKIPQINFKKLAKQSADDLLQFRDGLMKEDDEKWAENIKKEREKRKRAATESSEEIEEDDDVADDDEDEDEDDDAEDEDEDDDVDVDIDDDDDAEDEDDVDVDDDDDDDADVEDDDDVDVDIDDDDDEDDDEAEDGSVDESDSDAQEATEDDGEEDEALSAVQKVDVAEECVNKDLSDQCSEDEQVPLNQDKNVAVDDQNSPVASSPATLNGTSKRGKKKLKNKNKNATKEEVVIVVGRKRKLADAFATPIIQRGKHLRSMQNSPRTPQTPGSTKKLQFILQRNTIQTTSEYDKLLKEKPGNPYDSSKKPRYSVLKCSHLASPVNPFYTH